LFVCAMADRAPTIALWLDSADIGLIDRWIAEERLPNLADCRKKGFHTQLQGLPHSLAEVVQTTVITGCPPEMNHYWGVHAFDPTDYSAKHGGIYDYRQCPPFFAVGDAVRSAIIDIPQYQFHPDVHGWQVRNWGCHSAMTPTDALPPEAVDLLDREVGVPPIRTHSYTTLRDTADMRRLLQELLPGIDLRFQMLEYIIAMGGWDFVLTPFAELHKGGHYFVPNPDSMEVLGKDDPWAALRGLYERLDQQLGRFLQGAAKNWNVALFSIEGLYEYSDEPHNSFLLGDLLLRDSFGGRGAFVYEDPARGPSPEAAAGIQNWVMEAWHQRRRIPRWQTALRKRLGPRRSATLEVALGWALHPEHPATVPHCDYQPLQWIEKYRPHMRAFALPTFSDGFIRINVRGRERHGRISARRFRDECDRLTTLLDELRDGTTGQRAVRNVIRTRDDAHQTGSDRPPADLVVQWHPPSAENAIESPVLGRLGPVHSLRASTHCPHGFFTAVGPDLPAGQTVSNGHINDVAPTLLDLLGVAPPALMAGRSLLRIANRPMCG